MSSLPCPIGGTQPMPEPFSLWLLYGRGPHHNDLHEAIGSKYFRRSPFIRCSHFPFTTVHKVSTTFQAPCSRHSQIETFFPGKPDPGGRISVIYSLWYLNCYASTIAVTTEVSYKKPIDFFLLEILEEMEVVSLRPDTGWASDIPWWDLEPWAISTQEHPGLQRNTDRVSPASWPTWHQQPSEANSGSVTCCGSSATQPGQWHFQMCIPSRKDHQQ